VSMLLNALLKFAPCLIFSRKLRSAKVRNIGNRHAKIIIIF
jgi:hypothetical protein